MTATRAGAPTAAESAALDAILAAPYGTPGLAERLTAYRAALAAHAAAEAEFWKGSNDAT